MKEPPVKQRTAIDILKKTGGTAREASDKEKQAHHRKRDEMYREHGIPSENKGDEPGRGDNPHLLEHTNAGAFMGDRRWRRSEEGSQT
jgi:hypothetical protein